MCVVVEAVLRYMRIHADFIFIGRQAARHTCNIFLFALSDAVRLCPPLLHTNICRTFVHTLTAATLYTHSHIYRCKSSWTDRRIFRSARLWRTRRSSERRTSAFLLVRPARCWPPLLRMTPLSRFATICVCIWCTYGTIHC